VLSIRWIANLAMARDFADCIMLSEYTNSAATIIGQVT
jgi:hypothetical protein